MCETCDKCFVQNSDLKNHQYIHAGDKPYRCDTRAKCLTLKCYLKRHQRVHTGDKPYAV